MRHVLIMCILVLATGCAALPQPADPKAADSKRAKTLFDWRVGAEPDESAAEKAGNTKEAGDKSSASTGEKNTKKNGTATTQNGNDDKDDDEEPDEIVTDRPDFTEASSTVGEGRVQLEAGYTFSQNRHSGIHASHSYPEALLRVGVFADWFEFRVGQNLANTRAAGPAGPGTVSGHDDLYLGVKLGLTEQKRYLPEMALIIQATVPSGHSDLTAGKVLPGLNLLYGWDVIPDRLSLGGSSQGNATVDDQSSSYFELAQSITVGYSLTRRVGAYTEFFAFFPHGATAPDTVAQYYANGGFTFKVTPNLQLDTRAGVGLSRQADDFFVGSGFAIRY